MKYWLMAIRPKTLTASVGPVLLGISLAYYMNGRIDLLIALATIGCALLLQIATNLVNDYYDGIRGTDTQMRLGPTRVTQSELIPAPKVKMAFILCFALSFILGLYLMWIGKIPIVIIGLASILFAYLYTGGPWPLSHFALGEVLAFVFFGPIAVWGSFYLQTLSHHPMALLVGCGPGFISAALMAINNLRDISSDEVANKFTLAVLVGEKSARLLPLFLVLLSMVVPVSFYSAMKDPVTVNLVSLTPFLFMPAWRHIFKAPINEQMNEALAATGKYLFVYSLAFSLTLTLDLI